MKKSFFILLSTIVIFGQIFAAENPSQSSMDTTLYENCLELISAMHETACNETYASLILTGSLQEETEKLLLDIRNSRYHVPEAVYQLDSRKQGYPWWQIFQRSLIPKIRNCPHAYKIKYIQLLYLLSPFN